VRGRATILPDGRRLHLQDGPIDLVIEAFGSPEAVRGAREAAIRRFAPLLDELCGELALLRGKVGPRPVGAVARRMHRAVMPFADETFISPMAAVAGAVAEEILAAMLAAAPLDRAYVNNGGDIALHLEPGETFTVGVVDRPDRPALVGTTHLAAEDPVRGIATSGWRGRSFSLGIADAVTVLAETASQADAAATIIGNAVDLPGHPSVMRLPARTLQPDSDLGDRLVTRQVVALGEADRRAALAAGAACAEGLIARGLILGAAVHLQGETAVAGSHPSLVRPPPPRPRRDETSSRRRGDAEERGCSMLPGFEGDARRGGAGPERGGSHPHA
jgi:ApbE superfamily uncharacterized protein (UPF0280 family)